MRSRILHSIALAAMVCLLAGVADSKRRSPDRLKEFYVVDVADFDTYPYWGTDILDVKPEAGGTRVRYISVDAATAQCGDEPAIQGARSALANAKVTDLAFGIDFCALDPKEFNRTVAEHVRKPREYYSLRSAVVARCKGEWRVFQLPNFQMDVASLKRIIPSASRIARLSERVLSRAFPNHSLEASRSDLLPDSAELRDVQEGRFDQGFWFVAKDGEPPGLPARVTLSDIDPSFGANSDVSKLHNVLARYKHPERKLKGKVTLVSTDGYKLVQYADPEYSILAVLARIEGKAEFSLHVNPKTGRVQRAVALSASPMIIPTAQRVLTRWRFDPSQSLPQTINAVLDFSVHCE